jgi:hypothetical protein
LTAALEAASLLLAGDGELREVPGQRGHWFALAGDGTPLRPAWAGAGADPAEQILRLCAPSECIGHAECRADRCRWRT